MFKTLYIGSSITAIASVLSTSPLLAETETAVADTDKPVEEIVVIGEKRAKSLQETVSSVRVITADTIEVENIDNIYDVFARTANVASANSDNGFNIRGIDAFSVSGGGSSYLASVYVDGAALPRRAVATGPLTAWDVAQVEILRGPQSTLQGRNALAGAVVIRTQDPTYEWDARGMLTFGNGGLEEYAFAGGGPLIEDQVAFRVAVETTEFDGFIDNITTGIKSDFDNDTTLRAKLLIEPEGLEGFKALLVAAYNDHETGHSNSIVDTPDRFNNRLIDYDAPTQTRNENTIFTAELSYDVSDIWSLTSITSYNENRYSFQWDSDATAEPLGTTFDDNPQDTFTQELRANFEYDRLKGVIGAYYFNESGDEEFGGTTFLSIESLGLRQILTAPPTVGGFGLPAALADGVLGLYAPVDPVVVNYLTRAPQDISSVAGFADVTYDVSDKFSIFGGFRIDHEKQTNEYSNNPVVTNRAQFPDPTNPAFDALTAQIIAGINGVLDGQVASASASVPRNSATFNAFLPKLGVSYRWTDDITTSFTVQKGYRSGGLSNNVARATSVPFDQESTWNYELSFRSQWLDRALTVNANAFYIDWSNQQLDVQLSGNDLDRQTENAGSSRVLGFELESFYQPNENLSLYATLGFSDTKFREFLVVTPTETYDLSGRPFADASKWTMSAGATYRDDNGFIANLNINYRSRAKAIVNPSLFDSLDPDVEPVTLVNTRIGYEGDNFGVFVFANNLFDVDYVSGPDLNNNRETLGDPRTYGIQLQFKM